jgi:hypothetical protein
VAYFVLEVDWGHSYPFLMAKKSFSYVAFAIFCVAQMKVIVECDDLAFAIEPVGQKKSSSNNKCYNSY